jgi:hypothetical protein
MPRGKRSASATATTAAPEVIHHDRTHARCGGTGYLIEHYVVSTTDGESWRARAWDCSCRVPIDGRANFDRDSGLKGMNQDQLDANRDRGKMTTEERARSEGILSRILAMPPSKRFGAIMGIINPADVPAVTVIE